MLFDICTVCYTFCTLVFKDSDFNNPTDLKGTIWNTVNLFIKKRYVNIIDFH